MNEATSDGGDRIMCWRELSQKEKRSTGFEQLDQTVVGEERLSEE